MTVWRDAHAEFVRLLAWTRARKIRERRPASDAEVATLFELYQTAMTTEARAVLPMWQALENELRADPDPLVTSSLPADEYEALQRALDVYNEHARAPLDDASCAKAKKPRHRPPGAIPTGTVKQLKPELAKRKARPRDPELTQEKIAARLGLSDRSRVQQAEALQRVGWDLLRSHPEFSAKDGFVRWPSAAEAARILESERAEN